jgi:hypothetical protein
MERKARLRQRIAQETARIIAEEGVTEPAQATRKAAMRLGAPALRDWPRPEEIEAALSEYHRIFRSLDQPRHIARLRQLAREAMRFLREFSPWLVGGVWDGSAGRHSSINLHLFPQAPEDVMRKLLDARIPFAEKTGVLALESQRGAEYPALEFYVNDTAVEMLLLPPDLKGRSVRKRAGVALGGSLDGLEQRLAQPEACGPTGAVAGMGLGKPGMI